MKKSIMYFAFSSDMLQGDKVLLKFPASSAFSGYYFYLPLDLCRVDKKRENSMYVAEDQFTMLLCMNDEGDCANLTFDQVCYEMMKGA